MTMANACDIILNSVRSSNLNFACQETPFSIYLTIRKTQVKLLNPSISQPIERKDSRSLVDENSTLKEKIQRLMKEIEASKDDTKILLDKLNDSEATVYRQCKEIEKSKQIISNQDSEMKIFKTVIKKNNSEISRLGTEESTFKKAVKAKTKEIHDLEKSMLNQQENIKHLKEEANRIKTENKNLEKQLKTLNMKVSILKKENAIIQEKATVKSSMTPSTTLVPSPSFQLSNKYCSSSTGSSLLSQLNLSSNSALPITTIPISSDQSIKNLSKPPQVESNNNNNDNSTFQSVDLVTCVSGTASSLTAFNLANRKSPTGNNSESFLTVDEVRNVLEKAINKQTENI